MKTNRKRFKVHVTSYHYGRRESSGVSQHINDVGHNIKINNKKGVNWLKKIDIHERIYMNKKHSNKIRYLYLRITWYWYYFKFSLFCHLKFFPSVLSLIIIFLLIFILSDIMKAFLLVNPSTHEMPEFAQVCFHLLRLRLCIWQRELYYLQMHSDSRPSFGYFKSDDK